MADAIRVTLSAKIKFKIVVWIPATESMQKETLFTPIQKKGTIDTHRGYNLLIEEDPIDYTLDVDFNADGPSGFIKLVNELFKACLIFSFREDMVQSLELVPELSLHHNKSDCSPLADTMADNLLGGVGDVLQAISKQKAPSIHYGGGVVRRQM
jgi:hypothetical protein